MQQCVLCTRKREKEKINHKVVHTHTHTRLFIYTHKPLTHAQELSHSNSPSLFHAQTHCSFFFFFKREHKKKQIQLCFYIWTKSNQNIRTEIYTVEQQIKWWSFCPSAEKTISESERKPRLQIIITPTPKIKRT